MKKLWNAVKALHSSIPDKQKQEEEAKAKEEEESRKANESANKTAVDLNQLDELYARKGPPDQTLLRL